MKEEESKLYEYIKEDAKKSGFTESQLNFMMRLFTVLIESAIDYTKEPSQAKEGE